MSPGRYPSCTGVCVCNRSITAAKERNEEFREDAACDDVVTKQMTSGLIALGGGGDASMRPSDRQVHTSGDHPKCSHCCVGRPPAD